MNKPRSESDPGPTSIAVDADHRAASSGPSRSLTLIESAALAHAGILLLWITWGFGGAAEWMRGYFTWWGGLGAVITIAHLRDPQRRRGPSLRSLHWLWPIIAFNALVGVAALNPSFKEVRIEAEIGLAHTGGRTFLPSSARPELAIPALLLFDALWLTAFNLALVVRQRRAIRGFLLLLVINGLALAVFGTVQKLGHAPGIYFGQVLTKQTYFFASFVYHNHWGAFVLLVLATCLALVWHYARRHNSRSFSHSPAFGGLVAMFFLAATVPLSGSRSSSLLAIPLLGGAFFHWIFRLVRMRRQQHESAALPVLGGCAAVILAGAGVWYVAQETISTRAQLTRTQVSTMWAQGSIGSRTQLYGDTWAMAKAKPWFGWGMESYPHVFGGFFNTQSSRQDRLPVFYRDAHSDWLQAFAEHGFVGTALLGLCALVPLASLRAMRTHSPLPLYLLAGCVLILVYAWIEFPFGNAAVVFTWWLCFFCAIQYARLLNRDMSSSTDLSP